MGKKYMLIRLIMLVVAQKNIYPNKKETLNHSALFADIRKNIWAKKLIINIHLHGLRDSVV